MNYRVCSFNVNTESFKCNCKCKSGKCKMRTAISQNHNFDKMLDMHTTRAHRNALYGPNNRHVDSTKLRNVCVWILAWSKHCNPIGVFVVNVNVSICRYRYNCFSCICHSICASRGVFQMKFLTLKQFKLRVSTVMSQHLAAALII